MTDQEWDKFLKIKTSGRDDSHADDYRYPYEPTPYGVLERVAQSGWIRKKDLLVDYGCGKGRVSLFLAYETKCRAVGVEFDETIFRRAEENQKSGISGNRCSFLLGAAEYFAVPKTASSFFFFNPFSVEILKSVMARILESYYEEPREMTLFFYYPSDEYVAYLMSVQELSFEDEIDTSDLFEGADSKEKILIFRT